MRTMKHTYNRFTYRQIGLLTGIVVGLSLVLASCGGLAPAGTPTDSPAARFPTPTTAPALRPLASPVPIAGAQALLPSPAASPASAQGMVIRVDTAQNAHPISPL